MVFILVNRASAWTLTEKKQPLILFHTNVVKLNELFVKAFELAGLRGGKVMSVDKANVLNQVDYGDKSPMKYRRISKRHS